MGLSQSLRILPVASSEPFYDCVHAKVLNHFAPLKDQAA
jgi:hypothetical protein